MPGKENMWMAAGPGETGETEGTDGVWMGETKGFDGVCRNEASLGVQ